MEQLDRPEYHFRIHSHKGSGAKIPVLDVSEPFSYLCDLDYIRNSEFQAILDSLTAVLEGRSTEIFDFGGECTICTTEGEKTYCVDIFSDGHCIVETKWMLEMLKGFQEFRQTPGVWT